MRDRWRQRLSKIGVLGLATIVGLVVCEVALRLVLHLGLLPESNPWVWLVHSVREERDRSPDPAQRLFRPSQNRVLGWEPIPGFTRNHIRINSAGFRGPEVEQRNADDVVRIVVLGDSETFGMRLEEAHTFPAALEAALGDAYPAQEFEVLNFGVPGYSTAQEKAMLEDRALAFDPDGVVLYYVLNDPEVESRTHLISDGAHSRSYLLLLWKALRLARSDLVSLKETARSEAEYYHLLHSPEHFAPTRALLREVEAILSSRGIPFVLVVSPSVSGYDDLRQYPYARIHQELAGLSSPTLRVLDPLPAVIGRFRDPKELWITPTDSHKNSKASRVIAEAMAVPLGEALGIESNRTEPAQSHSPEP